MWRVCWTVILCWPDPIYLIPLRRPLNEFFSQNVQGPIGTSDPKWPNLANVIFHLNTFWNKYRVLHSWKLCLHVGSFLIWWNFDNGYDKYGHELTCYVITSPLFICRSIFCWCPPLARCVVSDHHVNVRVIYKRAPLTTVTISKLKLTIN